VDVTPNVLRRTARMTSSQLGATSLVVGPHTFQSFDSLVDTAARTLPARSKESLRVAVRHNSVQGADGRWRWRHDRVHRSVPTDCEALWADVERVRAPYCLSTVEPRDSCPKRMPTHLSHDSPRHRSRW
jgi:hypothetical protein